ncbi:MAG TPA: hypothetical protein ENJ37_01045 [Deltaproteobacteria bacterium]|nr:hypothetical protein [Deltaproteobacteria bacterium]
MTAEEEKRTAGEEGPKRGVKKQFFGCVLLVLGLLNTMLTLKLGLEPDPFNYLLVLGGAIFLGAGIWQGRNGH